MNADCLPALCYGMKSLYNISVCVSWVSVCVYISHLPENRFVLCKDFACICVHEYWKADCFV